MDSAIPDQLQTSNKITKKGPNPAAYRDIRSRDLVDLGGPSPRLPWWRKEGVADSIPY